MKQNRFVYVIFIAFSVIGIGFLIGAALSGWHYAAFKAEAEEITGEITEIKEYYDTDHELQHRVYVSYTFEGMDYKQVRINSYNSSMYEGKEITLLCDPKNPQHIEERSAGTILIIILTGIGTVFTLVGIIPLFVIGRKHHRKKELLAKGHILYAVVDSIEYNTSMAVNGRHPFVIFCSYRDEYQDITYRFKSENLWTDPSLVFPPGSSVEVYVEPDNYSKYYVNAQQVLEQKIVDYT